MILPSILLNLTDALGLRCRQATAPSHIVQPVIPPTAPIGRNALSHGNISMSASDAPWKLARMATHAAIVPSAVETLLRVVIKVCSVERGWEPDPKTRGPIVTNRLWFRLFTPPGGAGSDLLNA